MDQIKWKGMNAKRIRAVGKDAHRVDTKRQSVRYAITTLGQEQYQLQRAWSLEFGPEKRSCGQVYPIASVFLSLGDLQTMDKSPHLKTCKKERSMVLIKGYSRKGFFLSLLFYSPSVIVHRMEECPTKSF